MRVSAAIGEARSARGSNPQQPYRGSPAGCGARSRFASRRGVEAESASEGPLGEWTQPISRGEPLRFASGCYAMGRVRGSRSAVRLRSRAGSSRSSRSPDGLWAAGLGFKSPAGPRRSSLARSLTPRTVQVQFSLLAEVAELADALRSGRSERKLMWVQIPPSAPAWAAPHAGPSAFRTPCPGRQAQV